MQVSAFAAGVLILVTFLALHESAALEMRIVTRIASAFAQILTVTSSLAYYIQLASMHQVKISAGDLDFIRFASRTRGKVEGRRTRDRAHRHASWRPRPDLLRLLLHRRSSTDAGDGNRVYAWRPPDLARIAPLGMGGASRPAEGLGKCRLQDESG